MLAYFILLLILLTCFLFESSGKVNFKSRQLIHVLLAFFSGFRYNVGVDYQNYISTFYWDTGFSVNEPGFAFLINKLHELGFNYQMMFLIMASVTQYFVYQILKRLDKGFWFATIAYYCFTTFYIASFNGSRQYAAIAIVIWALKFASTRELWKYMTSVIIATFCFHTTALLFAPIYFYLNYNFSRKIIIFQIIIVAFCARYLDTLISYTPYLIYLERDRDMPIHDTVYLFTLLSFYLAFFKNQFKDLEHDQVVTNMNLLCLYSLILVLMQTSGMLIQMMLRINSYFLFAYLLILPKVIYSLKLPTRKYTIFFVIFVAVLYLGKTIIGSGEHYSLVPYKMNFNLFDK